eukprot:SM000195S05274  [mRNA]  locus=s195:260344:263559:+ [translate_table: standard]
MLRRLCALSAALVALCATAALPFGSAAPLASRLRAGKERRPPAPAQPDFELYHHSDALFAKVDAFAARHAGLVQVEKRSRHAGNYSTSLTIVTVGQQEQTADHRIRVLLVASKKVDLPQPYNLHMTFSGLPPSQECGQHAREPITSELALSLRAVLVGEYLVPGLSQKALQRLLSNLLIKIVPLENVNGRKLFEAGAVCERKNGRGVDLNRNWGLDWGKKEKDYDPKEEFPGTGPFSEPESQLLRQLALDFRPHLWVNVHSGSEALFIPYDHRSSVPQDGSAEPVVELLSRLNAWHCSNGCAVGSGGAYVGYLAHGTAIDHLFEILGVPIAVTLEIYGDESAHVDDCFRAFNPVNTTDFSRVLKKWTALFVSLLNSLPQTLEAISQRLKHQHAWSRAPASDVWLLRMSSPPDSYQELQVQTLRVRFAVILGLCAGLLLLHCLRRTVRLWVIRRRHLVRASFSRTLPVNV